MATPKQEKIIKLVLENLGKTKDTKTLGELLLEAGYSKSVSENPFLVFESETVQEALQPTVDKMKRIRDKALKSLDSADLDGEKPKDVTDIVDKLQKNIQLLSGEDTERIGVKPVLVKFLDAKPEDNRDSDRV